MTLLQLFHRAVFAHHPQILYLPLPILWKHYATCNYCLEGKKCTVPSEIYRRVVTDLMATQKNVDKFCNNRYPLCSANTNAWEISTTPEKAFLCRKEHRCTVLFHVAGTKISKKPNASCVMQIDKDGHFDGSQCGEEFRRKIMYTFILRTETSSHGLKPLQLVLQF